MSYVMMADLIPALQPKQMFFDAPGTGEVALEYAAMSGRKGAAMPPPPPPMPGAPVMGPGPMAPAVQQVQEPPPPWFGRAAADAFETLPPASMLAPPTQAAAAPVSAPGLSDDHQPYVEYVIPKSGLNEAAFQSSAALEAGGDLAGGDDDMSDQMVYEGLTGHDATMPVPENMSDTVDAGGQESFVDVASQPFSLDDGEAGIDETLVEPGQAVSPAVQQPSNPAQSGPPVFTPGGNGSAAPQNGNGRPKQRQQARNGNGSAAPQNGNGAAIMPRNRVTAFTNATCFRQGAGTAARTQEIGPPDPASFGWGMGQTTPTAPRTGLELASQIINQATPLATAAITRTPPTFTPDAQMQQAQSQPSYTPWLVGAGILGLFGVGYMIWKSAQASQPAPVQVVATNPHWVEYRPAKRKTKSKSKPKKSKPRR